MNAFRAELTEAVKAALIEYRRESFDRIKFSEAAKRLGISDRQFAEIVHRVNSDRPDTFRVSRDSSSGYKYVRVADVEAYVERQEAAEKA